MSLPSFVQELVELVRDELVVLVAVTVKEWGRALIIATVLVSITVRICVEAIPQLARLPL